MDNTLRGFLQKRWVKWSVIAALALLIGVPVGARVWISYDVRDRICSDISQVPKLPVAIVLGNQALPGGVPSPNLASRCDKAVELYRAGNVAKLLMTGDGRASSYDEPETMRAYAVSLGVPKADVIVDPLGMRTYDSVYRAKHLYGMKSVVVVTQAYHVPRTLFLAEAVGLDAYAVSADLPGDLRDQIRECMACVNALLDVYVLSPKLEMKKKQHIPQ